MGSRQMARTKIYTEWKLQEVEEEESWQEITSDLMLTNLIVSIKDFGLFIKIMDKEEI